MKPRDGFILAPSLVSAPLTNLKTLMGDLDRAGADVLHIDIEDGHFMPGVMNLGLRLIGELRPLTSLPFDVHLMVSEPEVFIPQVIDAGADMISVHVEACPYPRRTLRLIREGSVKAGLAFNPNTPVGDLNYLRSLLDYVNILTTEPELPDWPFLPEVLNKASHVSAWARSAHPDLLVQIDGGINEDRIGPALATGARMIVAGRSAFAGDDLSANIQGLRSAGLAELG